MIGDYSRICNKSGETRRLQRIAAALLVLVVTADVVSELALRCARTRRKLAVRLS
jgi:hypothetical protein